MGARHENYYEVGAGIDAIRRVISCRDFCEKLNLELKSENPDGERVWYRFHHGVTFTSWGEKITITLTPRSENLTSVVILSECGMPTQFIDWGKNKSNVNNIFKYIEQTLLTPCASSEHTPPRAKKTDESVINFCNACGNRVIPGSVFCSYCGKKLR